MATADHNISKIQVKSDGQQPVVRHLNLTADRFGDIVDEENDLVISIYPPSLKRPQSWDLKEVTTMVESVYDLYAALESAEKALHIFISCTDESEESVIAVSTGIWDRVRAALRRARGEK